MRKELVIFFFVCLSLKSYSQNVSTKIFFNGIDTFFIGDKKEKYIDSSVKNNFTLMQTELVKNHFIQHYVYKRDSLVTFKIDTIYFRNAVFTFNNSDLATIDLNQIYKSESYPNPIKYAKSRMDFLEKYISSQLNKKGKPKVFTVYKKFKHHGYEWKNGNFVIFLSIQYDLATLKYVSLDLYISNTKLEAQY
jgi:hypothetical protein